MVMRACAWFGFVELWPFEKPGHAGLVSDGVAVGMLWLVYYVGSFSCTWTIARAYLSGTPFTFLRDFSVLDSRPGYLWECVGCFDCFLI